MEDYTIVKCEGCDSEVAVDGKHKKVKLFCNQCDGITIRVKIEDYHEKY